MVPEIFEKWACSLSGCDGGDLNADVWISGIEWGAGGYDDGRYYREELPLEIRAGAYTPDAKLYDWNDSLTYRFGLSFAKLYTAMNGHLPSEYRDFTKGLSGEEVFKLNLYPIAFDSTDPGLWHKYKLDELTGFTEKHLFQTWCFYNRFPAFTKLVNKHRPKVIIGTGVGYLNDFFACYGGTRETASQIQYEDIVPASNSSKKIARRIYWVPINERTTLFIIPFFSGVYGLNSDYLLERVGTLIRVKSEL